MEVVHVGQNDEYEAQCTICGCRSAGTLKVESMIANGGLENTAENAG